MSLIEDAMTKLQKSNAKYSELILDRDTLAWVILMLETRLRSKEGSRSIAKFFKTVWIDPRVNPLPLDVDFDKLDES